MLGVLVGLLTCGNADWSLCCSALLGVGWRTDLDGPSAVVASRDGPGTDQGRTRIPVAYPTACEVPCEIYRNVSLPGFGVRVFTSRREGAAFDGRAALRG